MFRVLRQYLRSDTTITELFELVDPRQDHSQWDLTDGQRTRLELMREYAILNYRIPKSPLIKPGKRLLAARALRAKEQGHVPRPIQLPERDPDLEGYSSSSEDSETRASCDHSVHPLLAGYFEARQICKSGDWAWLYNYVGRNAQDRSMYDFSRMFYNEGERQELALNGDLYSHVVRTLFNTGLRDPKLRRIPRGREYSLWVEAVRVAVYRLNMKCDGWMFYTEGLFLLNWYTCEALYFHILRVTNHSSENALVIPDTIPDWLLTQGAREENDRVPRYKSSRRKAGDTSMAESMGPLPVQLSRGSPFTKAVSTPRQPQPVPAVEDSSTRSRTTSPPLATADLQSTLVSNTPKEPQVGESPPPGAMPIPRVEDLWLHKLFWWDSTLAGKSIPESVLLSHYEHNRTIIEENFRRLSGSAYLPSNARPDQPIPFIPRPTLQPRAAQPERQSASWATPAPYGASSTNSMTAPMAIHVNHTPVRWDSVDQLPAFREYIEHQGHLVPDPRQRNELISEAIQMTLDVMVPIHYQGLGVPPKEWRTLQHKEFLELLAEVYRALPSRDDLPQTAEQRFLAYVFRVHETSPLQLGQTLMEIRNLYRDYERENRSNPDLPQKARQLVRLHMEKTIKRGKLSDQTFTGPEREIARALDRVKDQIQNIDQYLTQLGQIGHALQRLFQSSINLGWTPKAGTSVVNRSLKPTNSSTTS